MRPFSQESVTRRSGGKHFSLDRRSWLRMAGGGFGALAFDCLDSDAKLTQLHHAAKAKRVIQIFCPGGMSQVDTFDYKPELSKRAGKPFDPDGNLQFFASKPGNCQPSFWKFSQHGECGRWVSELFPNLARHVDSMAFLYSMHSKSALHGPACFMMNTGFTLPGYPSMGSWVTYGLGSETDELPSYVVLPDSRGLPPGGVLNWGAGFLPATHQAVTLDFANANRPIRDLYPPESLRSLTDPIDQASLEFLDRLNRRHLERRSQFSDLEARINAYEMAAKLQLSAPEVADLKSESKATSQLYHLEDSVLGGFGRQCLMARRLSERGVRFVQVYCGAENTTAEPIRPNWDSHEDLPRDHGYWGRILDSGAAALLTDLQSRGLLKETLVICTTEFGRQPAAQGDQALGRDHNAGAFTAWMAGGGVRGGVTHGSTDELGYQAEDSPTYCYDLHATALHLLGIDHTKLSFYHNGIQRRLTDVHGKVIHSLIR